IRQWEEELTVTADYVTVNPTFVALLTDDEIVGFHALKIQATDVWLDHLWVRPAAMGKGIGRALFAHAEGIARGGGAGCMKIVGDPHAEGFYRHMGASVSGWQPASMDGAERFLPLLCKAL